MKRVLTALLCLILLVTLSSCAPLEKVLSLLPFQKGNANALISTTYTDATGTQYMGTLNGEAVRLPDDAEQTYLTRDRKHVVYKQPSGKQLDVIMQDTSSGKKQKIYTVENEDAMCAIIPTDRYVMIVVGEAETGSILVYDMKDRTFPVKLENLSAGEFLAFQPAATDGSDATVSFSYVKDKSIYAYTEGDKSITKIYTVSGATPELLYFSANGDTVVWSETSGSIVTVRLSYRGKVSVAARDVSASDEIQVNASADGRFVALLTGNTLTLLNKGSVTGTVKDLGEEIALDEHVYTDRGLLPDTSGTVKGIYLEIDDVLWYVDASGQKSKILSNLSEYVIRRNKIYYIQNEVFYLADVKDGAATDRVRLGADVPAFQISADGNFACFCNMTGALYAFRYGEELPNQVVGSADYFYMTTQNGKLFFIADEKRADGDASASVGTLMEYDYKSDRSRKIADNVECLSIHSGLRMDGDGFSYLDPSSFEFLQHTGAKDSKTVFDLKYYNGKSAVTVWEKVAR